ncbi:CoA ester lyase [Nocardioides hungaricus]
MIAAAARSLLFVPGDRPDRFEKAASSGADAVVLDLEDAVPAFAKGEALSQVVRWLSARPGGRPAVVRVNGTETATHVAELTALAVTSATVMLPKAESATQLEGVRRRLGPEQSLIALVETVHGVRGVDEIAGVEGVARLALGTIDLAVELGIDHRSSAALAYSRSRLVFASAAAGLPGPIDGVTTALDDFERLTHDVSTARELGFTGKLCIHPRQVQAANIGFSPTEEELSWATRVVRGATDGVSAVDGAMIDRPVIHRAQQLLSRHAQWGS